MKQALCLFLIVTIALAVTPCGRCVGKGDVCAKDACVQGFRCTTLNNKAFADMCYPVVAPEAFCGNIFDYNPCETGFSCNYTSTKCEIDFFSQKGYLNDGCLNDKYCSIGLVCIDKICKIPQGAVGVCNYTHQCAWNQYCNNSILGSTCQELPGAGQTCRSTSIEQQCKHAHVCNSDNVCTEIMSVGEGGACTYTIECNSGLECYEQKCVKPSYHYLLGPGAIWGPECDPTARESGCICNYGSKIFQYLKEVSVTYPESIKNLNKDFEKCMTDKGCTSPRLGRSILDLIVYTNPVYESCLRKNCLPIYNNLMDNLLYPEPTLRPPHCGSNIIFVMMLAMVILMLL